MSDLILRLKLIRLTAILQMSKFVYICPGTIVVVRKSMGDYVGIRNMNKSNTHNGI